MINLKTAKALGLEVPPTRSFWAQDTAILTVQCVGIRSSGSGSIVFASRQFAIMDVDNVRIGQAAGGAVMSAREMSKINCLSGVIRPIGSLIIGTATMPGTDSSSVNSCLTRYRLVGNVAIVFGDREFMAAL